MGKQRQDHRNRHDSCKWAAHFHEKYVTIDGEEDKIFFALATFRNKYARLYCTWETNEGEYKFQEIEVHWNDRHKVHEAPTDKIVMARLMGKTLRSVTGVTHIPKKLAQAIKYRKE